MENLSEKNKKMQKRVRESTGTFAESTDEISRHFVRWKRQKQSIRKSRFKKRAFRNFGSSREKQTERDGLETAIAIYTGRSVGLSEAGRKEKKLIERKTFLGETGKEALESKN